MCDDAADDGDGGVATEQQILGQAEDWKKYLAIGICALMVCFNLLRISRIRQAEARVKQSYDQPT